MSSEQDIGFFVPVEVVTGSRAHLYEAQILEADRGHVGRRILASGDEKPMRAIAAAINEKYAAQEENSS